jgi:hypothetical protein
MVQMRVIRQDALAESTRLAKFKRNNCRISFAAKEKSAAPKMPFVQAGDPSSIGCPLER